MAEFRGEVLEDVLGNGLKVLVKEVHKAPVATCWIWYKAGSRNELPGITGVSHWVEHMLFKGAGKFGKGEIFKLVTRYGGYLNGMTFEDFTLYFETLPSNKLEVGLEIESERMMGATFDPREVESERTVIISEREGAENLPPYLLAEELKAASFLVHPYRWPVVGLKCDLQAMTRDDLYSYYRSFYALNNAILILVGDFDAAEALSKVRKYFGGIEAKPKPPSLRSMEPPQHGERRVLVRRPGNTSYIQVAYHTPPANHPDIYPLMLLDAVLSGGKPISWFSSGGWMGRSARLYRALVEKKLAVAVGSSLQLTIDPGLFRFYLTVRDGVNPAEAEKALLAEVDRVKSEPPSDEEMARALRQIRAQFAYSQNSVTAQAHSLGYYEALSSYKNLLSLVGELSAVVSKDVRRVAEDYLTEDNRTVGLFIPRLKEGG